MLFSLISSLNSRMLSVIHQKMFNIKNILKIFKTSIFPMFTYFCCSPKRNPILENQLTVSPQQH